MKDYTIAKISGIISPLAQSISTPDARIEHLLTDSRSLMFPETSLFFAITTKEVTDINISRPFMLPVSGIL